MPAMEARASAVSRQERPAMEPESSMTNLVSNLERKANWLSGFVDMLPVTTVECSAGVYGGGISAGVAEEAGPGEGRRVGEERPNGLDLEVDVLRGRGDDEDGEADSNSLTERRLSLRLPMRLKGLSDGILLSLVGFLVAFVGGEKDAEWKVEDESMMKGILLWVAPGFLQTKPEQLIGGMCDLCDVGIMHKDVKVVQ